MIFQIADPMLFCFCRCLSLQLLEMSETLTVYYLFPLRSYEIKFEKIHNYSDISVQI